MLEARAVDLLAEVVRVSRRLRPPWRLRHGGRRRRLRVLLQRLNQLIDGEVVGEYGDSLFTIVREMNG